MDIDEIISDYEDMVDERASLRKKKRAKIIFVIELAVVFISVFMPLFNIWASERLGNIVQRILVSVMFALAIDGLYTVVYMLVIVCIRSPYSDKRFYEW